MFSYKFVVNTERKNAVRLRVFNLGKKSEISLGISMTPEELAEIIAGRKASTSVHTSLIRQWMGQLEILKAELLRAGKAGIDVKNLRDEVQKTLFGIEPDKDKPEVAEVARDFADAGFKILSSKGTGKLIQEAGIDVEIVNKLSEGRPNILDLITNGKIDIIINTPVGHERMVDDSYLRKAAIKKKIAYFTTMAAAKAAASGVKSTKLYGSSEIKSLQELHSEIKDK